MKKLAIVGLSMGLAACTSSSYTSNVTSESYREDYSAPAIEQPVVTQDGALNGISENNLMTENDVMTESNVMERQATSHLDESDMGNTAEPDSMQGATAEPDSVAEPNYVTGDSDEVLVPVIDIYANTPAKQPQGAQESTVDGVEPMAETSIQTNETAIDETNTVEQVPTVAEEDASVVANAGAASSQAPNGYTIQIIAVTAADKAQQVAQKLAVIGEPVWSNAKVVNGVQSQAILLGSYPTAESAQAAMEALPASILSFNPFVKSLDKIKNSEFPVLNKLQ